LSAAGSNEGGLDLSLLLADQARAAGLLDQFGQAGRLALAGSAPDEVAHAVDDVAGPQGLGGGLVDGVAHLGLVGLATPVDQAARAGQQVGDGRQRLVQLVGQGRGHLAHGRQARDVDQLVLQFLQPRLGALAVSSGHG
jgi:hypothetical protein